MGMEGDIDTIKYIMYKKGYINDEDIVYGAARGGHRCIIQWVLDINGEVDIDIYLCIASSAARGGHRDIIQWMLDEHLDTNMYGDIACSAAEGGYKDIIQWMLDISGTQDMDIYEGIAFSAARGGYREYMSPYFFWKIH